MTKEELWQIIIKNNPQFLTTGANLTPKGLIKLVDDAYDQGHKQGMASGKSIIKPKPIKPRPFSDTEFLQDILGIK